MLRSPTAAAFLVLAVAAAPMSAQRATAKLKWKKHEVAIDYGAVGVGKHDLSSLAVGQDWRMGMNQASQVRLDVPLVAGDEVTAPGSYRVKIYRASETELQLQVDGAGHAIGARSPNVRFPGELQEPKKPSKKLEIEFRKPKSKAECETCIEVDFGETKLEVPVRALGAEVKKGKVFILRVFDWPTEMVAARTEKKLATPIASLTRKKVKKDEVAAYNVLLDDDAVRLVPQMAAPTDSNGFGTIAPPNEEQTVRGKVQWAQIRPEPRRVEAAKDDPLEFDVPKTVELVTYTDSARQVLLQLTIGKRNATMTFTFQTD